MNDQISEPPFRVAGDFTFYLDEGRFLVRAETPRAQRHLEDNVATYEKWLVKFHFANGSSIFCGPGPGGGIFLKPKANLADLGEALFRRGFVVVRNDERNPPFIRLVVGRRYDTDSPWLLQMNNCRVPRRLAKMILAGVGTPN